MPSFKMISFKHYLRLRPEQYCIEVKRGIMDRFSYIVNNISRKLNITSELWLDCCSWIFACLFYSFRLLLSFCSLLLKPQGVQTICLCNRFLLYSKCIVFTVCFLYCDILLNMYIVNVKYIALPHLRYIVALFTRKSYFERFGRILSWPFTVPLR